MKIYEITDDQKIKIKTARLSEAILVSIVESCKKLFLAVNAVELEPVWLNFKPGQFGENNFDFTQMEQRDGVIVNCRTIMDQFRPIVEKLREMEWSASESIKELPDYSVNEKYRTIKYLLQLISSVREKLNDKPKLCEEIILHLQEPQYSQSTEDAKTKSRNFATTWLKKIHDKIEEGLAEIRNLKIAISNTTWYLQERPLNIIENRDPELIKQKIRQQRLKEEIEENFDDFLQTFSDYSEETPWRKFKQLVPKWEKMQDKKHRYQIQKVLKEIDNEMQPYYNHIIKTLDILDSMDHKIKLKPLNNRSITLYDVRNRIQESTYSYVVGLSMLENAIMNLNEREFFQKVKGRINQNKRQYIIDEIEGAFHYLEESRLNVNRSLYILWKG